MHSGSLWAVARNPLFDAFIFHHRGMSLMLRSTQISYSLAYCSFVMALNPEGCRAARIRKNGVATMSRAGNSSSHSIVTNSRYRIQNRSSPAIMVATSRIILISFVERQGSGTTHGCTVYLRSEERPSHSDTLWVVDWNPLFNPVFFLVRLLGSSLRV